jgi:hypothetical protein
VSIVKRPQSSRSSLFRDERMIRTAAGGRPLEHDEERNHEERRDHQQLVIIDVSNDLGLLAA